MSWFDIIKSESLKELQEERRNNFMIYNKLTGLFGSLKPLLKIGVTASKWREHHNKLMGYDIDLDKLERIEAEPDSIQTRLRISTASRRISGVSNFAAMITFKTSVFTPNANFYEIISPGDLSEIIKKHPEFNVKIQKGPFYWGDMVILLKEITKYKLTGQLKKHGEGYVMPVTSVFKKLFYNWYKQPLLVYFEEKTLDYITALMESGGIESLEVQDV